MPGLDGRGHYLSAEAIAQWFFRLNGCLTIDNFVLHPEFKGSARTEVDVIALRLPHRQELQAVPMADYPPLVSANGPLLVFADTTYRGPCKLNATWTDRESEMLGPLLMAIGLFSDRELRTAVPALYEDGRYEGSDASAVLCAIGSTANEELAKRLGAAWQWTWGGEILPFIFGRIHDNRMQKANVHQWDETGLELKRLALGTSSVVKFLADVNERMIS